MTKISDKVKQEQILDEYYSAIGRLNCYFQTMEHVYKNMYFAFVEDRFNEKRYYKTSVRKILDNLEIKLNQYYDSNDKTLKTILDMIARSRKLAEKRDYYIHSFIIGSITNNEEEQIFLYKRTKECILQYENINGEIVLNDDYTLLNVEDIKQVASEINYLNGVIIMFGVTLEMKRQNEKGLWSDLRR